MTKAHDYVSDPTLACLPLALRQRMATVQQERIDAGHTAVNGFTYRTMERKLFADKVADWKARGSDPQELIELKAEEAQLRKEGKF